MKKIYEAWENETDCSITFSNIESISVQRAKGLLSENAKLLHRIKADTWEEAISAHYIKMGWKPYVPVGEPQECPRECGASLYPEGSGECPNCGSVC